MKKFFSYLFIPCGRNNYRAAVLHPSSLFIFLIVLLLSAQLVKAYITIRPGSLGYSSQITSTKVLLLTNYQRQIHKLPPLHFNSTLALSARKKAQHMLDYSYFDHLSPTGLSPWDFVGSVNYKYSVAGENLAKDFFDADSMISAWMKSLTHKENLLNERYQETGIAVVEGVLNGVKTTIVVQHFASPESGVIDDMTQEEKELNSLRYVPDTNPFTKLIKEPLHPQTIIRLVGIVIILFLLISLLIDGYYFRKLNIHRFRGSSFSHIALLLIIFLLVIGYTQGTVY